MDIQKASAIGWPLKELRHAATTTSWWNAGLPQLQGSGVLWGVGGSGLGNGVSSGQLQQRPEGRPAFRELGKVHLGQK